MYVRPEWKKATGPVVYFCFTWPSVTGVFRFTSPHPSTPFPSSLCVKKLIKHWLILCLPFVAAAERQRVQEAMEKKDAEVEALKNSISATKKEHEDAIAVISMEVGALIFSLNCI
jgi:hypothetical protein